MTFNANDLMKKYTIDNLPESVDRQQFVASMNRILDRANEPIDGSLTQRDQSVKFTWGHSHDFGEFQVNGVMGYRHIKLIQLLVDHGYLPDDLTGKSVIDIGCWTGGTSLLLAAMGANVTAIEEVSMYSEALHFLCRAFKVRNILPLAQSLYDTPESKSDYILLLSVLSHVTDPIVALRVCFNSLKDGGRLILETKIADDLEQGIQYCGPTVFYGGSEKDRTRIGWNWLIPSLTTLQQMLKDVGLSYVCHYENAMDRVIVIADRIKHQDMCRSGLSIPVM